jgi:hypothetical protein
LFLALEPLWRAVDGDGDPSAYAEWIHGGAGVEGAERTSAAAGALGLNIEAVTAWCIAILEAWREASAASPARPIEPWHWWWRAGEASRAVGATVPRERLIEIDRAYHLALGADLDSLGIGFDVFPRRGRPPVPVAFTTFGSRPVERSDGTWAAARPWVLATYRDGGLGELAELVHETGHAIHVAAIRARPAFADWPDSDAFTEGIADLLGADVSSPAWLARWVDPALAAIPAATARRGRFAEVALDAAWALFEIRLRESPGATANEVWTDITSRYLGITPHAEWSWWAIRGQLLQSPGYMANYAIGAVIAADVRAAIREVRGDWIGGDPGWYAWVSEQVYRFGAARSSGDVLRDVLGRAPRPDALLAELAGPAEGTNDPV